MANNFNSVIDELKLGLETRSNGLSSIFGGQWYFILDHCRIKLCSAEPDMGIYAEVYEVPAAEVSFLSTGCQIRMDDHSGIEINRGRLVREKSAQMLNAPRMDVMRLWNANGSGNGLNLPPKYLTKVWEVVCRDELVTDVKVGMVKLLEARQLELRKLAEQQAADMLADLSAKEAAKLASRKLKQLNAQELQERHKIELKAASLVEDVKIFRSYKEVYEELSRLLLEKYGPPPIKVVTRKVNMLSTLNMDQLICYLESVSLPGASEPMPRSQIMIALRDMPQDANNQISINIFKDWFTSSAGRKLVDQLQEKNMFAVLLEEELCRLEGKFEGGDEVADRITSSRRRTVVRRSMLATNDAKGINFNVRGAFENFTSTARNLAMEAIHTAEDVKDTLPVKSKWFRMSLGIGKDNSIEMSNRATLDDRIEAKQLQLSNSDESIENPPSATKNHIAFSDAESVSSRHSSDYYQSDEEESSDDETSEQSFSI